MRFRGVPTALALAILASLPAPAQGREAYVQPLLGSDASGDGSLRRPYQTLTWALGRASPGDHVRALPGTYSAESGETFPLVVPAEVTLWGGGEQASRIEGVPGMPVIRFPSTGPIPETTAIRDLGLSGGSAGIEIQARAASPVAPLIADVLIEGNESGILLTGTGTAGATVRGSLIGDNQGAGPLSGNMIDEVAGTVTLVVSHTVIALGEGVLLQVASGNHALSLTDCIVTRCAVGVLADLSGPANITMATERVRFEHAAYGVLVFSDILASGCSVSAMIGPAVFANPGTSGTALELNNYADACPMTATLSNAVVSGSADGVHVFGGATAPLPAVSVESSTFDITGLGFLAFAPYGSITVRNAIVVTETAGAAAIGDGVAVTYSDIDGGFPGIGNFDADPGWVDAAVGDYNLAPGSSCIDRGDSAAAPARDIDSFERVDDPATVDAGVGPITWLDIGAHEYIPVGADTDGDGVADSDDGCIHVVDPGQEDLDLDGIGDACDDDADGDAVPNLSDGCVLVANPLQEDLDADGLGDACDADVDGDLVDDTSDDCPLVPDPAQSDSDADGIGDACDACGAGLDADADNICDAGDNCQASANVGQEDLDGDGAGDACDADDDADGVPDASDDCPAVADPIQSDVDGDTLGDDCDPDADDDGVVNGRDVCPLLADGAQADRDRDGIGDACDADNDNDGVLDAVDNCPAISNAGQQDADADGVGDPCDPCPQDAADDGDADGRCADVDNCPLIANPAQENLDRDGEGDACDLDVDGDGLDAVDDCNDRDGTALRPVAEVTGLRVTKEGSLFVLAWDSQALTAGSGARYDVVQGTLGPWNLADPWGTTGCTLFSVSATQYWTNLPWSQWLLVRARNTCGVGSWGDSSVLPDPRDALDASSGCP